MRVILPTDAIKPPITGVGRYTLELARRLANVAELDLRFLSGATIRKALPEPDPAAISTGTELIKSQIKQSAAVRKIGNNVRQAREWWALHGAGPAIFHGTNYTLPRFFRGPSVATIHDLSIYTMSHCHPSERVRYMEVEIERSIARAELLITDSAAVRDEISSFFGLPNKKLVTIPLAARDSFKPREPIETQAVLSRYGLLHGQYCLYVGTIEPRKNVDTLLDAYRTLSRRVRDQCPLVVCGHPGWGSEKTHQRLQKYAGEGWLLYLGYVPESSLPVLLSGSRLFVFPTLYEGFGLPILEALKSGVPTLCSNLPVLKEVAGNTAIYFNPHSADELSIALQEGIEDVSWRHDAISSGSERATKFSWEKTAESTVDVYRKIEDSYL